MNKEKNIEWIKEKFAKGKEEVIKFTKISKLKIELVSEKKKMDEKLKNLGLKLYGLTKEGEVEIESLDAEKDSIVKIEQNIESILSQIESVKEKELHMEDISDNESKDEIHERDSNVVASVVEEVPEIGDAQIQENKNKEES